MKSKENRKNNLFINILKFPKYIFLGIYFVVLTIFKIIISVPKNFIYGILFIFSFPFRRKAYNDKKIIERNFDGNVINDQDAIDNIFNDKKKKTISAKKNNQRILIKKEKKEKEKAERLAKKNEKKQARREKIEAKKEKKNEILRKKKEKKLDKINKQRLLKEEKNKKNKENVDKITEERKQTEEKIKTIDKETEDFENEKNKKADTMAVLENIINEDNKEPEVLEFENNSQKLTEKQKKKKIEAQTRQEKRRLAKEKKAEAKLRRQQKIEEKKALKEKAKLDKKEAELAKKRKNEDYISDKYAEVKKKRSLMSVLKSINNLPEIIKNKIKGSYENSLLYKNAKNKRDKNHQVLLINFDGEDAIKSEEKQVYEYTGKNAEGKIVKDYFPAYSRVEVHSFLLSEGFEVYSIKTSKLINFLHRSSASINTKFKTKDLLFFLTQLSTYIKAGIPLVESLKILSRQFKRKGYQKIFRSLIYNLTIGDSFSIAMEKQGNAFPKLLVNMIKASEMTGELPEALDDMAEYYTQAEKTRKQMITALTYPTIVFVFALGVITFIMLYVVPKFVDIYNSMDEAAIPEFTVFVLNVSYFLQDYALYIFAGLVALIIANIFAYKKIKAFRFAVQWVAMHLPIVKDIIIYNEVTMFTKTFSSLLAHNVFITDTLEILSKITNNEIYKMLVKNTAANLERGEKISTAYKDQWAFPIPAYEMIVTGERTGQLPEMMSKVSTYYQELHENTVSRIKAFVEPILIVGLTVVVGFIVLAIVIPMFNMYNQVI